MKMIVAGFAISSASCFLFKDAIFDFIYSVFPSFHYWTACPLPAYFLERKIIYVMLDFPLPQESHLLDLRKMLLNPHSLTTKKI